ncbi:MAG TPA: protein kinase [Vicinamibacterales bacterium]|nr:protein kinase [Vicinamibacterales bacterium]
MSEDGERGDVLAELFDEALKLEGAERRSFRERISRQDADLASNLDSLLAAHERPGSLEGLASQVMPEMLDELSQVLASDAQAPWQTVGHYEILAHLGSGGMGEVYQARDLTLDRLVALKFLPSHLAADPESRQRLKREARAASALDHPNIAVVFEIGTTGAGPDGSADDRSFIAMAYYPGETIKQKIARGPLPVAEAIDYATQTAQGLEAAHATGIVHRDIKPANVMVTRRGEVKIVDFGIARSVSLEHTCQDATPGTMAYMSPEQTRGQPLDHRSDIWSLGVMLFEMLTGERPFKGDDDAALVHAIRHETPRPLRDHCPGIPAALERVVETCLAKNVNDRFQRTGELLAALHAVEETSGEAASGVRFGSTSTRIAAAGSLLILALTASVVLVSRGALPPGVSRTSDTSTMADAAPTISVFPFAATAADSELERIGRDLMVTLTAGLDGMGALKTLDASAILDALASKGPPSLDDAHGLARTLSTERFVHGVLTRAGADIRVDLSVFQTGSAEATVRTSATAPDLPSLTDAAIIALLDELWERDAPDVPSLAAVRKSQVPGARRAYLQGELALTRQDMAAALDAFERAFAEDPTFWWAYWRSLYPRAYREAGGAADPALLQRVFEHRWELPLQDRLLIEAWTTSSRVERLSRLQELTERFPDYSPAWWSYANLLCHYGGYLGRTAEDARAALERFLALSPRFVSAWNHLASAALVDGESATASQAAMEEARWIADGTRRRYWIPVQMLRVEVARSRSIPPERLSGAIDLMLASPLDLATLLAGGFVADGSPAVQIELNRAVRQRGVLPALDVALWRGEALAWAARGAWSEALVAADRWARVAGHADGALGAYRVAVAGVLAGGVPARAALRRRPEMERAVSGSTHEEQAERAWLDGVLAYLQDDEDGIASARRAIRAGDPAHGDPLERSLAALATDATGDRERAARSMVELEAELADRGPLAAIARHHPFLVSANRLLAAGWLRSLGHDADAARLLTWYESMQEGADWSIGIGRISLVDRAEIAEAAGDRRRARRYYARFLQLYDAPDPALGPLVRRAAAGLERLEAASGHPDPHETARLHPLSWSFDEKPSVESDAGVIS